MKKVICLVLCLLLSVACAACGEAPTETTAPPAETKPALFEGNSLKILAIGNSFSQDATEYLYDVAKAEGITNLVIGRLNYGGCSLERHVNYANTGEGAYYYEKNTTGKWELTENATLLDGLLDEDWDIITMQQNSSNSGLPETYEGHLEQLISYVNEQKTNPNAKLIWHMTWAYQGDSTHEAFPRYDSNQMTMYTKIKETVNQVILPNSAFAAVFPVGTAIQNARTTFFGDNLTRDGFHLSYLGRLVASYTWYAVLTGVVPETIHLEKTINGMAVSEGMRSVIRESVANAIRDPYAVTQSKLAS